MNTIKQLADQILDEKEWQLSLFLSELLENPRCYLVGNLVKDILPKYSEKRGEHSYTLQPDPIYRPLYYLHGYAERSDFDKFSRHFIALTGAHIEGCLLWLTKTPPRFRSPSKPFGYLVVKLYNEKILPEKLSGELMGFNKLVNVPAKHFTAKFRPQSQIEERTFSCFDASLAFMMMRRLSMQLFDLLLSRGVVLPQLWKKFDNNWLSPTWRSPDKI